MLWVATMILALYFCGENKKTDGSNGKTNTSSDEMKDQDTQAMDDMETMDEMPTMSDRVGKVYYAASTGCQAGDYSDYPHGLKSVTIECGHNGKLSKLIAFASYLSVGAANQAKNYNTPTKRFEVLFRADGTRERWTTFHRNGNKWLEYLNSADGTIQSDSHFYQNGNKWSERLYRADETTRKVQYFNSDGTVRDTTYYMAGGITTCTPSTTKCVASDPD